jgi:hypothetical protein
LLLSARKLLLLRLLLEHSCWLRRRLIGLLSPAARLSGRCAEVAAGLH